jgi:hypothetical protein
MHSEKTGTHGIHACSYTNMIDRCCAHMVMQLRQMGIDIAKRRTAKRDRQRGTKSERLLGLEQADKAHRLLKDLLRSRDLQATVVDRMLSPDRFQSLGLRDCHGSFSPAALSAIEGKKPVHHPLKMLSHIRYSRLTPP